MRAALDSDSAAAKARAAKLDGVLPTAIEALDRKRKAMKVLRDIDALLRFDNEDVTRVGHSNTKSQATQKNDRRTRNGGRDGLLSTPGPGAYSPEIHDVHKQARCRTKFDAYSGRSHPSLPWKRKKPTDCTPGPGAYATARAESLTKPRVVSASIRSSPSICKSERELTHTEATAADQEFAASTPRTTLTRCALVAYKLPAKPNYRTREQKLKVRYILAARKRWTSVGYYDVKHAIVERRLGSINIIPMAKQAASSANKFHPTRFRRKMRMWRRSELVQTSHTTSTNAAVRESKESDFATCSRPNHPHTREQVKDAFKRTEQWQRAQARQLLRTKELKARVLRKQAHGRQEVLSARTNSSACNMSKQQGRDIVTCRRRKQQVITSFIAAIRKEHATPQNATRTRHYTASRDADRAPGREPFALTTGREDIHVDAFGMYILGTEADQRNVAILDLNASDAATQPKTLSAIISASAGDDERFPMTAKRAKEQATCALLDPKFETIEPSVLGHRFVRFGKQLDRPDFFSTSSREDDGGEQLVLPSDLSILQELKFPTPRGFVSYSKMRGRENIEKLKSRQPLDLVAYETGRDNPMAKRAPAPVDMDRMLPRAALQSVNDANQHKDLVLCTLRANHDEIEKAMRLLSTFKRPDVGFVDMSRATARSPRLHSAGVNIGRVIEEHAQDAAHVNLDALSTRPRSDQTLVNLTKSLGRHVVGMTGDDASREQQVLHLLLRDRDAVLSKRKRLAGLVDMKKQLARDGKSSSAACMRATDSISFFDPARDSVTTRFLRQRRQLREHMDEGESQ